MSKELQKEFTDVLGAVAREVSENVIKNTALRSVEKMNKDLKELQTAAAELVSDVRKAQAMYDEVAKKSSKALKDFNLRVDGWSNQQENMMQQINDVQKNIDKSFSAAQLPVIHAIQELAKQVKQLEQHMEEHMEQQDAELYNMKVEQINKMNTLVAKIAEAYEYIDHNQQESSALLMTRINWTLGAVLLSVAVSGAAVWLLR